MSARPHADHDLPRKGYLNVRVKTTVRPRSQKRRQQAAPYSRYEERE